VVGFTTGSRGKVPGKTCEKRRRNYNNSNNKYIKIFQTEYEVLSNYSLTTTTTATTTTTTVWM
jgi:hypothetical protein